MIKSFYIDNFKSLVDFRLPPAPHELGQFTCLVGLNGSGKSTVLQAFDFMGHLVSGQVTEWLRQREWEDSDLKSRFLNRVLINFELLVEAADVGRVSWKGAYNVTLKRCTTESVMAGDQEILSNDENGLRVSGRESDAAIDLPRQGLQYEGSVLSILDPKRALHEGLKALKTSVGALRSLDMLTPREMRRRSRDAADIGYGGERLSGYVHKLSKERKDALLQALQVFYPQLRSLSTKALRAGWRDLSITETYVDAQKRALDTPARQINDGLLRVMAVVSQAGPGEGTLDESCLLFDEIENGINQEQMGRLVGLIRESHRQVIVTTHSPLVLNYLPDDVAERAVIALYRAPNGHTRAVRLFDLPSARKKLELLGPGEVYADARLEDLLTEAEALHESAGQ